LFSLFLPSFPFSFLSSLSLGLTLFVRSVCVCVCIQTKRTGGKVANACHQSRAHTFGTLSPSSMANLATKIHVYIYKPYFLCCLTIKSLMQYSSYITCHTLALNVMLCNKISIYNSHHGLWTVLLRKSPYMADIFIYKIEVT
jgi:hypothetical protein